MFPSLARLAQESLKRDPYAGEFYVFRGRCGGLIKIIWQNGYGVWLFASLLRHLSSLLESFGLGFSRSGRFRGKSEDQFSASK
jgi:hypothetical protein